jgi:hypothetical protein
MYRPLSAPSTHRSFGLGYPNHLAVTSIHDYTHVQHFTNLHTPSSFYDFAIPLSFRHCIDSYLYSSPSSPM